MKKLLIYLKAYRKEACLAPIFKMLEAVFELFVPLVIKGIIDYGIAAEDRAYCLRMGLLLLLLAVIGLAMATTAQWFSARAAAGFAAKIKQVLMEHIQKLSYTELDTIGTSTLITRMTSDVNQVQTGINMFLRLFMRSPFIVFGATIMAFSVNAKASRVFFITLPVLIVIVFGIMLVSIPLYKKVQSKLDTVTLKSRENLSGVRVIRAFNQEKKEKEEFAEVTEALTKGQLFVGKISSFLNPLTYAVINLSIVALIWGGAKQVDLGILKQGQVYALVNYMSQILIELVKLANLIITETKAVACANRLGAIFETTSSQIYETAPVEAAGGTAIPKVEFVDAGLTYAEAKESSIEGLSLKVKRGETIGIIGGTGSGKSTLVNLIPRFYDCTQGSIKIDGVDVKEYPKEQLIEKIGVVPQKAVLFSGTIADNIRWGKEDATNEEIEEALSIAQAEDFVQQKEGGIEFVLNQGGKNLSGGQKQRLTIARALVKKPEILILDDSSSALDYATDAALRKAIKEKTDHTTVFLVSQRASSIMYADKIVVLDDGKIAGIGDHDTLMKNCPVYQEIYASQNKEVKADV